VVAIYCFATCYPENRRISGPFLSSDDYADRAHRLYTDGRYDDALTVLQDAIEIFPQAAELHVGLAYARLARDEVAWALRSFNEALALEPYNEDGLAGLGEVLLKVGQPSRACRCFDAIVALGFREDQDLMLQVGRALFREGVFDRARDFFEMVLVAHPESGEAAACLGYAAHRLADDEGSIRWLLRALELEPGDSESRIYLGNVLYDRGDFDGALAHFDQTHPQDHLEELALWRFVALKKSMYRLSTDDPELQPWVERLKGFSATMNSDDQLLSEIEAKLPDGTILDPHQLDFFAAHLSLPHAMLQRRGAAEIHNVTMSDGAVYRGTWEQIVLQILGDDTQWLGGSLAEYMHAVARRNTAQTGIDIPSNDAESFIRGIAQAGLLRIST
jgi:tetratricopeptide (TPR) repeat protein